MLYCSGTLLIGNQKHALPQPGIVNGDKTPKGAVIPLPTKFSEFHSRRGHILGHFHLFSLFYVISPNSVALGADNVKVVDDKLIMSATKIQPKESSFTAIFAEATENECINYRHCQRTDTYISATTDPPCNAVSVRELS